jgi:DNA modification methylase
LSACGVLLVVAINLAKKFLEIEFAREHVKAILEEIDNLLLSFA